MNNYMIILDWVKKHNAEKEFDDIGYNCYIRYSSYDKKWHRVLDYDIYNPTTIYMTEDGAKELVDRLNNIAMISSDIGINGNDYIKYLNTH